MKKHFVKLAVTAVAAACMLAVPANAANVGGATVDADSLNLRSGASLSSPVIAQAPDNSVVILSEKVSDEWYRVWYYGLEGYMSSQYLRLAGEISAAFGSGVITGSSVRLRAYASLDSPIIGLYNTGDTVTVIGVSGVWYKVGYAGGVGYIHSDYIRLGSYAAAQDSYYGSGANDIVEESKKYLGVAYVWAGGSPSGFDCSGFVNYVFKQCGYSIDRIASDIATNGVAVSKSELVPGDIVCFTDSSYSSVGHVGIYIGDGQFIHASSGAGRVMISELDSAYYLEHYSSARRIA